MISPTYSSLFRIARKEVATPSAAMNSINPIRINIIPLAPMWYFATSGSRLRRSRSWAAFRLDYLPASHFPGLQAALQSARVFIPGSRE
jgi:hypothetical protein